MSMVEREREERPKLALFDRFEDLYRKLAFKGCPNKQTVTLIPTTNCLCSLTEWPAFVLPLNEVERVHLERVQFGLKNFDMAFIFKDYTKKVALVASRRPPA